MKEERVEWAVGKVYREELLQENIDSVEAKANFWMESEEMCVCAALRGCIGLLLFGECETSRVRNWLSLLYKVYSYFRLRFVSFA